jgi:hypothetical protein
MSRAPLNVALLLLALAGPVAAASSTTDTPKTDSKGVTLEDVWRGVKRAEQNIEKEIPKVGPAIVNTFNKIIGKAEKKNPSQSSEQPTK